MKSIIRLIAVLLAVIATGCAEQMTHSEPVIAAPPPARSDFDDLLEFGANMAAMPTANRVEVCRSLQKRGKDTLDQRVPLQLMIGRLVSDACGDIGKILDSVGKLTLNDPQLQKLVAIDSEALRQIDTGSRKRSSAERKSKKAKGAAEAKEESPASKDEAQLLREKLEAIRSMEKQLDETSAPR